MVNQEYAYFKQRVEESIYDLYETIATIQKVILAKFLDLLILFGGVTLIGIFVPQTSFLINPYLIMFGYGLVLFIIWYFTRGLSLGYVLLGIRFVSVSTQKRASLKDFNEFIRKSMSLKIKYSQIFQYYFRYDNRLTQNEPMKRVGFIIVEVPKYKRFRKHLAYNIAKMNKLKE